MARDVLQACMAPVQVALSVLLVPLALLTLHRLLLVQLANLLLLGILLVKLVPLDIFVPLQQLLQLYVQQTLYALQAQLLNSNVLLDPFVIKVHRLLVHQERYQPLELEFVQTVLLEPLVQGAFKLLVLLGLTHLVDGELANLALLAMNALLG